LLFETEAEWAEEEFGVGPGSPFFCVEGVGDCGFLRGGELSQYVIDCSYDLLDGNTFILDFEEIGDNFAYINLVNSCHITYVS
jgi:hypothetical protein